MTEAEVRKLALDILSGIAPEADLASIGGGEDIRETLDIDSMDFLNFVVALNQRTGIAIPEADYPKLFTLQGVMGYLARHT